MHFSSAQDQIPMQVNEAVRTWTNSTRREMRIAENCAGGVFRANVAHSPHPTLKRLESIVRHSCSQPRIDRDVKFARSTHRLCVNLALSRKLILKVRCKIIPCNFVFVHIFFFTCNFRCALFSVFTCCLFQYLSLVYVIVIWSEKEENSLHVFWQYKIYCQ